MLIGPSRGRPISACSYRSSTPWGFTSQPPRQAGLAIRGRSHAQISCFHAASKHTTSRKRHPWLRWRDDRNDRKATASRASRGIPKSGRRRGAKRFVPRRSLRHPRVRSMRHRVRGGACRPPPARSVRRRVVRLRVFCRGGLALHLCDFGHARAAVDRAKPHATPSHRA